MFWFWLDALGRKKTLEQKREPCVLGSGVKEWVLWRSEVKSFLEYNGKEAIKKEDKETMSHRKLESGVGHTPKTALGRGGSETLGKRQCNTH